MVIMLVSKAARLWGAGGSTSAFTQGTAADRTENLETSSLAQCKHLQIRPKGPSSVSNKQRRGTSTQASPLGHCQVVIDAKLS